MKKFLSVIFVVLAVFVLYANLRTGNQSNYNGYSQTESSYRAGQALGVILPIASYVLSSVFFFVFDNIYKKSYIEGFTARKKQCTVIIVLIILSTIPAISACLLLGTLISTIMKTNQSIPLFDVIFTLAIPTITFIIPWLILALMLDVYYLPYRLGKKLFLNNDTAISEHLSDGANYTVYSQDGFVMANDKALFLPKFFCVIPFDSIESVKSSLPWLTVIKLTNGKKFKFYTNHYKDISEAVKLNKPVQ